MTPALAPIVFQHHSFASLDSHLLYSVLSARAQVFVVEQRCQYLDPDGKDLLAQHVLGFERDVLVAYLRILPAGSAYPDAAIGRVLTLPQARGRGVGRALMHEAMRSLFEHGPVALSLSAQAQLVTWYGAMGFEATSEPYDDAGIPHVSMRRVARPL